MTEHNAESVLIVPLSIKAQMARDAIAPHQLQRWWSPDTERTVDPWDDPEVRAAIHHLLNDIWHAPTRIDGQDAFPIGMDDCDNCQNERPCPIHDEVSEGASGLGETGRSRPTDSTEPERQAPSDPGAQRDGKVCDD